jgi:hypothetical protein
MEEEKWALKKEIWDQIMCMSKYVLIPLNLMSLSTKGMTDPRGGHPQDFDINISNKPNIYLLFPIFSHG